MNTPRLRKLFITTFHNAPLELAEHDEPWETQKNIRDAHFYVGIFLHLWQEMAHKNAIKEKTEYMPLPWYRQKTVCQKVVENVKNHFVVPNINRLSNYSMKNVIEVKNFMEESIDKYARKEYIEYLLKLQERTLKEE